MFYGFMFNGQINDDRQTDRQTGVNANTKTQHVFWHLWHGQTLDSVEQVESHGADLGGVITEPVGQPSGHHVLVIDCLYLIRTRQLNSTSWQLVITTTSQSPGPHTQHIYRRCTARDRSLFEVISGHKSVLNEFIISDNQYKTYDTIR